MHARHALTPVRALQADGNSIPESLPNAACGYGTMAREAYPLFALAGISTSNPLQWERPMKGCGTCLEVQCNARQVG